MCVKTSGTWAIILPKVILNLDLPEMSAQQNDSKPPCAYMGKKGPYPPLPGYKIKYVERKKKNQFKCNWDSDWGVHYPFIPTDKAHYPDTNICVSAHTYDGTSYRKVGWGRELTQRLFT